MCIEQWKYFLPCLGKTVCERPCDWGHGGDMWSRSRTKALTRHYDDVTQLMSDPQGSFLNRLGGSHSGVHKPSTNTQNHSDASCVRNGLAHGFREIHGHTCGTLERSTLSVMKDLIKMIEPFKYSLWSLKLFKSNQASGWLLGSSV